MFKKTQISSFWYQNMCSDFLTAILTDKGVKATPIAAFDKRLTGSYQRA